MEKKQKLTAHRYLNQCRVMQKKIDKLILKKQEYYEKSTSISSHLSPIKVQSSFNNHRMEEAVVDMVTLEEEIQKQIFDMQMQQNKIMDEIQQVRQLPYVQILYNVYIRGMHPRLAKKGINLKRYNNGGKNQYDKDFLFEDALKAFERCHPEIFAEVGDHSGN